MKYIAGSAAAMLILCACAIGDSFYDDQAAAECEEVFDPASASECRLDQVESRQVRRSERRNERNNN